MIQFKRTAFIVFTGLTPFTPAFGKANSRKCQQALKNVSASGALKSHGSGHEVEAVLIGSKLVGGPQAAQEVSGLVVLYDDGTACVDSSFIDSERTPSVLRNKISQDLASWRYNANHDVELRSSKGGLGGLTIEARVDPLPEDFRLEHIYTPLRIKAASEDADTSPSGSYQFLQDGTFYLGDVSRTDDNAPMKDVDPSTHGHYHIEGFTIQLVFDDGHVEEKTILTDKADNSLIWLDGDAFVDTY